MIFAAIFIWAFSSMLFLLFSFYMVKRLELKYEIRIKRTKFRNKIFGTITLEKIVAVLLSLALAVLCGFFSYKQSGLSALNIKLLISFCVMLSAFVIDYKTNLIPNILSVILLVSRVIFMIIELISHNKSFMPMLISSFLALIICFAVLFAASKVMHGGIGYGDIKIVSALGFMCGIYAIMYTLLFGLLISFFTALALVVLRIKKMKDYIPFGPFMLFGYVVMLILGQY